MADHTCPAIVVSCIDFRFQEFIEAWVQKNVGSSKYDRVSWAGGVFDLPGILKQIEISIRLHHTKKAILLNHEDCGAYGNAGTLEKHREDLLNAKKQILLLHPDMTVDLYYVHLDGTFEEIT